MPVPEKTEGPGSMGRKRMACWPVVGEACDARARKDSRAGYQGHKRLASPQTPQGLLQGKHAIPVPEKTEVPVCRDANTADLLSGKHAMCGRHGFSVPIISLITFSRVEQEQNLCRGTCVCAAEIHLGCKNALYLLIGVWAKLAIGSEMAFGLQMGSELALWLQIGVLAANWQSAANWRLGCKRAANWHSGCKLAFGLQTGNRQRIGVSTANLQRIGVWAANRQRTGVLAANWRLDCKLANGSELAFGLQIS